MAEELAERVSVLDDGYVILHAVLGSDLTVVNAARVSYNRKRDQFDERDWRLLRYMARHRHQSPFYHPKLQFEVKAPLMVARQWWRHVVDSTHTMEQAAWNELSRRYVQEDLAFYRPPADGWRAPLPGNKQASAEAIDPETGQRFSAALDRLIAEASEWYRRALQAGIAAEQARLFLPANALYTSWYWTASLWSVWHFCALRRQEEAQGEIQQYAEAVEQLTAPRFPYAWRALTEAAPAIER